MNPITRIKTKKTSLLVLLILHTFYWSAPSVAEVEREVETEILQLPGLTASVEIIKDRWGISHIYAENQQDLFFAQGYNAARDRLFQFELWRRRALGLLAEIQGEKAIPHDIGARLLKFRGDIQEEMRHYHQDGEAIITAFVDGVNAYITLTRDNPQLLPVEFGLLSIEPGYWTPEVVVSRHNALTGGAQQELMVAELLRTVGEEKTKNMLTFSHPPYLRPQDGIVLDELHEDIMAVYKASRNPPAFAPEDMAVSAASHGKATQAKQHILDAYTDRLSSPLQITNTVGSNNWIVAGSKTASGSPIMANDPHRTIQTPSLRYWAHLVAPGWNVIGGGEPTLPGISIGHNEFGAWGLTVFPIDQEDLYVYDINPNNPNQYRYEGHWEDMDVITETIPVKGGTSHLADLRYTRHGPVLYEDKIAHKAYALRAVWLDKGAAPYLASLRMDQASTWEEFRAACTYSGLPGENMIWADRKGNIGWQAVGLTPIRIGWDGLLPVPGDGRYEWVGYVPIKQMPHRFNPREGYWASANHNNVPEDYPNIFSFFFLPPFRLNRINDVLEIANNLKVEDSMALQYDVKSLPAEALVPLLSGIKPSSQAVQKAVDRLLHWDYRLEQDSVEAAIYAQWEKALSDALAAKAGVPFLSVEKTVEWLTQPGSLPQGIWGEHPDEERKELIAKSMGMAIDALAEERGEDLSAWRLRQTTPEKILHPLSHLLDEPMRKKLDVGPMPNRGDANTVNVNSVYEEDRKRIGASFRIIVDTSDWDLTKGSNTPGQSGDPESPHYKDLFDLWANGEFFPVYYSREKIEQAAEHKTLLKPLSAE